MEFLVIIGVTFGPRSQQAMYTLCVERRMSKYIFCWYVTRRER